MQIYLVGGAVRDELLGLPIKDRDWVVVGASPEQMTALGFRPVGQDFPVFLHPDTQEEYALARTERKTGVGYQGFTFNCATDVTLEDDLRRRDFTINAIAKSNTGEYIDPYGGRVDIERRIIRHVSDAFDEDPLRVLRAAKFKARYHSLGFAIAPNTFKLMKSLVDRGELNDLSAERRWQEIEDASRSPSPSEFWALIEQLGATKATLGSNYPLEISRLKELDGQDFNSVTRFAVLTQSIDTATIAKICRYMKTPKRFAQLVEWLSSKQRFLSGKLDVEQRYVLADELTRSRRGETTELLIEYAGAIGMNWLKEHHLTALIDAYNAVTNASVIEAGFKGASIGTELRRRRCVELEKVELKT